jgi:hypothetical protein
MIQLLPLLPHSPLLLLSRSPLLLLSRPPPLLPVLQGMFSVSRKAGMLSGFLQVGSAAPAAFTPIRSPSGPVLLGVQMLYGFNFSVSISKITVKYDVKVALPGPSPSPPPSPPSPPPPPPSPAWSSSAPAAAVQQMFEARNNVSFDSTTGAIRLQGFTSNAAALAPSAGLLSLQAFDGDIEMNATISAYDLVQ